MTFAAEEPEEILSQDVHRRFEVVGDAHFGTSVIPLNYIAVHKTSWLSMNRSMDSLSMRITEVHLVRQSSIQAVFLTSVEISKHPRMIQKYKYA